MGRKGKSGRKNSGKARTHIMLEPGILAKLRTTAKANKRPVSQQAEVYIERGLASEKAA